MKANIVVLSLLCAFIILTSGCTNNVGMTVSDNGEFIGVVSDFKFDLDSEIGVPSQGLIVDEKLALEIGNAVIKSVYNEDVLTQTEFVVCEIKDKDIFVVSRIPKGGEVLGGDYNVAISKKDGSIIKIWVGE